MSVDFPEQFPHDTSITGEAGFKTAHVLDVEGVPSVDAYSLGQRAGAIGSTLTILALRRMGLVDFIDPVTFDAALREVEEETGIRETLEATWDVHRNQHAEGPETAEMIQVTVEVIGGKETVQ